MLALNVSIACERRGLGPSCEVARAQTWRSLLGSSQSRMFGVQDNEAVTSTVLEPVAERSQLSPRRGLIIELKTNVILQP